MSGAFWIGKTWDDLTGTEQDELLRLQKEINGIVNQGDHITTRRNRQKYNAYQRAYHQKRRAEFPK